MQFPIRDSLSAAFLRCCFRRPNIKPVKKAPPKAFRTGVLSNDPLSREASWSAAVLCRFSIRYHRFETSFVMPMLHAFCAFISLPFLFSLFYFLFSQASPAQTNSELVDQIPPLRPPHAEIPPSFWEKYGVWIAVAAAIVLYIGFLTVWLLRRKTEAAPVPPEIEANEALKPFIGQLEDGKTISQISRIVRRYFTLAFGLPQHELTTSEFSKAGRESERLGSTLADRISEFLVECDHRKFALPNKANSPWAVPGAKALIELGEQRRQFLRQQERAQQAAKDARQS